MLHIQLLVCLQQTKAGVLLAADIGAKVYASSVEGCNFSTQEVILSMLEHDSSFKDIIKTDSAWFQLDPWELEFAVADAYRYISEYEKMLSLRGKKEKLTWATETGEHNGFGNGRPDRGIHMIICGAWGSKENVALRLLYTYWGIPYRHEV